MAKLSKRQKLIREKVDSTRAYSVDEAVALLVELGGNVKFKESVDVAVNPHRWLAVVRTRRIVVQDHQPHRPVLFRAPDLVQRKQFRIGGDEFLEDLGHCVEVVESVPGDVDARVDLLLCKDRCRRGKQSRHHQERTCLHRLTSSTSAPADFAAVTNPRSRLIIAHL
jgi:hypothetical protein